MARERSACPWCDTENMSDIDGQKFDQERGEMRNVHFVSCKDCNIAYWFYEGEAIWHRDNDKRPRIEEE